MDTSSEVECVTYGPEREVARGREEFFGDVVEMCARREATFTVEDLADDEEHGVVFVELTMEGLCSINIFHVEEGLVNCEREYLEDGYWRRAGR